MTINERVDLMHDLKVALLSKYPETKRFSNIRVQRPKAHAATQPGRLIEDTISQKYEIPHGPHAMIETQRAFYLVPWESTHAQNWGKRIKGRVLVGGGIDWDAGRSRGIGR